MRPCFCFVSLASVVAIAGCLVDRGPISHEAGIDDAPGLDAPGLDAPGLDAPSIHCVPLDCDDANPCTDDACTEGGCTHAEHTRACDDGVRCNGADQCAAGRCSIHDGVDPCAAPTHCDASSDTCVGCVLDTDCPGREEGVPGICSAGDVCEQIGTAERTVTTYTCVASSCAPHTSTETIACSRDTDGTSCAPDGLTDYGACAYVDATCSAEGTRSRSRTRYACAGGTCTPSTTIEVDAAGCARMTEGSSCGAEMAGVWSACAGFADVCDESGTHARDVVVPRCAAGTCASITRTETEACARVTENTACGAASCGGAGACMRLDATSCSTAGSQSRTCSTPVCNAGTCSGTATGSETVPCTVSTGGLPCTPVMGCSPCIEPGRTGCRSGHMGERFCSDGVGGTCSAGGFCFDSAATRETCMCP
ncbi:MAG: hypothetical protein K1X94_12265 [Sandaracinaceae bacterium]|nr:hypothetical protein [Sandaracinaceae bacterium]